MPAFRFKLQPVLDLREREERDRQRIVATLESRRQQLERALRDRQTDLSSIKTDLRRALSPGEPADGPVLRLQAGAAMAVQAKGQRLVLQLAGIHKQLEVARKHLAEASRRRRAVELLKERRYHQWIGDLRRREDAANDEVGTIGAARATANRPGGTLP